MAPASGRTISQNIQPPNPPQIARSNSGTADCNAAVLGGVSSQPADAAHSKSCTVGGASGELRIKGLPYASSSGSVQCLSVCPPISAFTWIDPTGVPIWAIQPSSSYMTLDYMKSGSVRSIELIPSLTSVGATFSLSGFGSYLSID